MALHNYGVLKGKPIQADIFPPRNPDDPPHFHVQVQNDPDSYDIAVNIRSMDGSEVLYAVNKSFQPPHPDELLKLSGGFTYLSQEDDDLPLDFVRQNLVDRAQMSLLPKDETQPRTSLHSAIDEVIQQAIQDPQAIVCAFGQIFQNGTRKPNPFFNFKPDRGIHDIHMNQGNPDDGQHSKDNGTFQDGALLVYFPAQGTWTGIFIAFQTQVWQTDEQGDPVAPAMAGAGTD